MRLPIKLPLVGVIALAGCADPNEMALRIGGPLEQPVPAIRAAQTGSVGCKTPQAAMQAAAAALQDVGMIIAETAPAAGLITASKQRDATETGQVVGAILIGLLAGPNAVQYDVTQTIRATVVVGDPHAENCPVRVAFERIILDNKGASRSDYVLDQQIYHAFFAKLRAGQA